ncbi:MAG: hypothetical protein OXC06_07705 [Acidimicrobiaceae bacterium]|nr:hypothetical protein [Acidimicrobiaceae bacterium]
MNSDVYLFSKDCSSAETAAQEARYLQALSGPGIVPVQDAGAGRLVLERAACSLADVLHERGPLPESEIRAVGAAAASALARVHGTGLVHGDVKPANLLLSHEGELWLADFDAARPADGKPLERHTPGRAPPGSPARATLDVTALALALVELATGSLLDPGTAWRAADLRRLGCSAGLSAELSFMLGDEDSVPAALGVADMFERAGIGPLPEPAVNAQSVDPTPTVEFMPARPRPRPGSAEPESTAAAPPLRWWRRLAASWRPR